MALRDQGDVNRWQETLTRLFNRNLSIGPPIEAFADKSLRVIEQKARNAEEALLAVLNACALRTLKISTIIWPDIKSAGNLLHRLRGQRDLLRREKTALECLSWLDMAGQRCSWQELGGADLSFSDLTDAELIEAILFRAYLRGAKLSEACLAVAILEEANLSGANLRGADLTEANLRGADLTEANLREADLSGANLRGARGLTQEQLDEAWGNARTKLPRGLVIRSL